MYLLTLSRFGICSQPIREQERKLCRAQLSNEQVLGKLRVRTQPERLEGQKQQRTCLASVQCLEPAEHRFRCECYQPYRVGHLESGGHQADQ